MRFPKTARRGVAAAAFAAMVATAITPEGSTAATPAYLYTLSDFSGTIPGNWVKLAVDPQSGEVYMLDTAAQSLRIFNGNGMETFRFPENALLASAADVAVDDGGKLIFLSVGGARWSVWTSDYRGESLRELPLPQLAAETTAAFSPDAIAVRGDILYLADRQGLKIATVPLAGGEARIIDILPLVGVKEEKRGEVSLVGFSVDARGNILFTVPVLFQAYILSPEGKLTSFGSRGSSAGKFNIVGGIIADEEGNIFVADTLRCVVMRFDREQNFREEFGYRGNEAGNLISPMDLATSKGKLFVTQSRNRGVSVFRVDG